MFVYGQGLHLDEVCNPTDGKRLEVVQSVCGFHGSVYTRIPSSQPSVLFSFLSSKTCFLSLCSMKEKCMLNIKSKEWGKKQLFSSVSLLLALIPRRD